MVQDPFPEYAFEESFLLGWRVSPELRSLYLKAELMRTFKHSKLKSEDPNTFRQEDLYILAEVEFYGVTFCRYCVSAAVQKSGDEDDYGDINVFEEVLHSDLLAQLKAAGETVPGTALGYPTAKSSNPRHFLFKSDYVDLEVVCEGVRVVESLG